MIALFIHDDATADLRALLNSDPVAAGQILALLEQLEGDHDQLDRLTQQDYGSGHWEDFHVSMWQAQQRDGRNLWRLKLWDLEDKGLRYRVVYAFVPQKQHYHVVAITRRKDFNYEESDPISQRILRAYQEL